MSVSAATIAPPISYKGVGLGAAHTTSGYNYPVVGGESVAAPEGYGTFVEAINAAKLGSAGVAPSVAVMDAGARFYLTQVRWADGNGFVELSNRKFTEIRDVDQNVRAFVEGAAVMLPNAVAKALLQPTDVARLTPTSDAKLAATDTVTVTG